MVLPPLSELFQRVDNIYHGQASSKRNVQVANDFSLRSLAKKLKITIGEPPLEALVMVVGNAGSGKTSFVNALAQELSLPAQVPSQQIPFKFVLNTSFPRSTVPRLLTDAAMQFPESSLAKLSADGQLTSCCSGRSASERLNGVQLMEACLPSNPADKEVLSWLASRAALIVCLMDSQTLPSVSEALMKWLATVFSKECPTGVADFGGASMSGEVEMTPLPASRGPALRFVFSKNDLITRESDRRTRQTKAQRLITEHMGRSFEILPASVGDLNTLLDCDMSERPFTVGGAEFTLPRQSELHPKDGSIQQDSVIRIIELAQESSIRNRQGALALMETDCENLMRENEKQMAEALHKSKAAASRSRSTLIQVSGAFFVVACLTPFVLEEDVERWLVILWACIAFGLALALMVVALMMPPPPRLESDFEKRIALLQEQARYLRLLAKQRALWCGESHDAEPSMENGQMSSNRAEGVMKRSNVEAPKANDQPFSI